MTSKSVRYFWIAVLVLLSACGQKPDKVTPTTTKTLKSVVNAPTVLPTTTSYPPFMYTVIDGDTCESIAETFKISIESLMAINNLPPTCVLGVGQQLFVPSSGTAPAMPSPTAAGPSISFPEFSLSGYVMTFIQDGDLYFQDGENPPVKLTNVGEKIRRPMISPDNQKILFYRSEGNEDIAYSINTDGTDERAVMPQDWLASLESGTEKEISAFIPHTHRLLVKTYWCEAPKFAAPCSVGLFIVDTDSTEITELASLGLAYQQDTPNRNIKISPDGKMIAAGTIDGVDLFTVDGQIIRDNILGYVPSTSSELFPSLFWLPDSSGLIVILPDTLYSTDTSGDFVAHTIWRYSVGDNTQVQISLDPPLMGLQFDLSPDGNWALYGGFSGVETSLYLADLTTGQVQVFGEDLQPLFSWGLDSKHFAYGTALQNVRAVDNLSFKFADTCSVLNWVDPGHFTCLPIQMSASWLYMAEFQGEGINLYDLQFDQAMVSSAFIKPK